MKICRRALEGLLGISLSELSDRRTGKSTGYALQIIGNAMINPNATVMVHEPDNNIAMDQQLLGIIQDILRKLELEDFKIARSSILSITYDPFVEIF